MNLVGGKTGIAEFSPPMHLISVTYLHFQDRYISLRRKWRISLPPNPQPKPIILKSANMILMENIQPKRLRGWKAKQMRRQNSEGNPYEGPFFIK
jgi:hypothetical protein